MTDEMREEELRIAVEAGGIQRRQNHWSLKRKLIKGGKTKEKSVEDSKGK